jgi:exodeoxyribonuclease-3
VWRHLTQYALCGDINIAHQEIDLKNQGQQKTAGFLAEESMTGLLGEAASMYRRLHPAKSPATPTRGGATGDSLREKCGLAADYHPADARFWRHRLPGGDSIKRSASATNADD